MAKKNVNQEEVVNEVAVVETEVINEAEELPIIEELLVTEEEVDEVELLKKKLLELEGKLNVNKENKREKNREKKEALTARIKSMAVEERMTRQQIVDKLKTEPGMEWIGYYYVQQILRGTGLDIVEQMQRRKTKRQKIYWLKRSESKN